MKNPTKLAKILKRSGSVLTPVVHDCLTAKLAENCGFEAVWVGGFAISGVNYGLPDVGLLGLSELLSATKNIIDSVSIPVLVDADGGYGNDRSVRRTIQELEKIGAAGVFIEDQVHPKRCGHMSGKEVITTSEMVQKIQAAVAARRSPQFLICARTDSRATHSLTEAVSRSSDYLAAGAGMIFIEAPESREELARIPKELPSVPLLVNMLEGGKTPLCTQRELEEFGYKMIAYPVTTLFSALKAVRSSLQNLKATGWTGNQLDNQLTFAEYKELVKLDKYL